MTCFATVEDLGFRAILNEIDTEVNKDFFTKNSLSVLSALTFYNSDAILFILSFDGTDFKITEFTSTKSRRIEKSKEYTVLEIIIGIEKDSELFSA
ncbi:MAG: hypothetical protein ACI86M_003820 [Saprospiraceae bacterium]